MVTETHKWKSLSRGKKAGILILLFLGGGVLGFVIWAETPNPPMQEALDALVSDSQVTVSTSPYITFMPVGSSPSTGFVIYPGGRVDERAYAPAARTIAEAGYLVVIVPMPLNLAVFGLEKGREVVSAHPGIVKWAIGGHSLGGAMAAELVAKDPGLFDGIVFWASYPSSDLSSLGISVLSISASNDGLSTPDKIAASHAKLPASATFYEIVGGNHAQFGWYGEQQGDNAATITRAVQQAQITAQTISFLAAL
ncbi:MAG: alpha/beta hydrolase [Candidatus Lokiarchaeota archaeon]|nr:alpha/beta hydrolase [Candidatus Lokiarchaeota archaeon]